ncbi:MAG: hypothetical protein ABI587_08945 [Gemmatimonadales bacterium]
MNWSSWLLALSLAGCGMESPWSPALAWPDCAPFDGAATRIVIPQSVGGDSASQVDLTLALYAAPGAIRGESWTISESSANQLSVSLCPAGGPCLYATSGWIRVESGSPGSDIRGQYRVTLSDGRVLTGRFSAPLQQRVQLCG